MTIAAIAEAAAIMFLGLLAGTHFGTGLAHRSAMALPAPVWVAHHQAEDRLFRRLMPPFQIATMLSLALAAYLAAGTPRWLFTGAALLTLITTVLTIARMVPLNKVIASWDPVLPPADWAAMRQRWNDGHGVRTVLLTVAFVLAALATVLA